MKLFKTSFIITILFSIYGCESMVDDINDVDPNKIATVSGEVLFTGIQLADIAAQAGILSQAGGVVSGYYVGADRLNFIQNYEYINTDSNTPWINIYQGVVKQARELRSGIDVPNKDFFYGASKILEAHAVGTAANIFGDVPFSEAANDDIPNPKYDGQVSVYNALQNLLDEAIFDLQNAGISGGISEDIFFGGDSNKWIKVAYTLKARLFLDVRDYTNALSAAQNGISSSSETMKYSPPNTLGADTNLLYEVITGSTSGGAITANGSFLIDFIGTGTESRNNAKTDEVDRYAYYYDGTDINDSGIAGIDEPMILISLQENLLIWAETSLRSSASNFNTALTKLNEHRLNLRNGIYFSVTTGVYDDYVEADFLAGGNENADGSLSKEDALLREIIEERYVTFFTTVLGFNDLRRTKKDPISIQVPVPFNVGSKHPERFLYPFDEENTNGANVPDIADIFVKTPINQ